MSKATKQKVTFSRFDVADYLKSEKDILAYLNVAAESGDPDKIKGALGDVARARNMSKIAREMKITRQGLSKALSPAGNPTLETMLNLTALLGLDLQFGIAKKPKRAKAKKTARLLEAG